MTTTSDPVTREQLAHAKLIIRQAQSQGGLAFFDYDRAFCQQKVADPSLRWNTLNPSLLASTTFGFSLVQYSNLLHSKTIHVLNVHFCSWSHPSFPLGHNMVCLRQVHVEHGPPPPPPPPPPPQCVTVGTEGHVLMAFDVMFALTVLLLVTKHPSVGKGPHQCKKALAHPTLNI